MESRIRQDEKLFNVCKYQSLRFLCNSDLPDDDLKLLNHAAELSMLGNEAFEELRSLYLRDMRLRVPPVIKSWYVEDEEEFRIKEFLGGNLSLAKYL